MELQSGLVRVASYRRKLPRKAKNIYRPTEVWVDVFCFPWISHPKRPKLGSMVPKIGNRWFGEQLQFYLHEWGKHSFGHLRFTNQGVMNYWTFQLLEYPQTTMPENIKFCGYFHIQHFDNQVYNFFRRIQSVLTADTKLKIRYVPSDGYDYNAPKNVAEQLGNARTILGHLLPLIDGIHTIKTDDRMLSLVKSFPPEKFHQIKVLDVRIDHRVAIGPIMEWLTASSNGPKLLQLCFLEDSTDQQVLKKIRKQFMKATKPLTFAVVFFNISDFPAFNCENAIGEELHGIQTDDADDYNKFTVFRHQANAEAGDQLRQWLDGNMKKMRVYGRKQCITFWKPTIGDGSIFALPDLDEEEVDESKEEDEDKPSTSKK